MVTGSNTYLLHICHESSDFPLPFYSTNCNKRFRSYITYLHIASFVRFIRHSSSLLCVSIHSTHSTTFTGDLTTCWPDQHAQAAAAASTAPRAIPMIEDESHSSTVWDSTAYAGWGRRLRPQKLVGFSLPADNAFFLFSRCRRKSEKTILNFYPFESSFCLNILTHFLNLIFGPRMSRHSVPLNMTY